MLTCIIQLLKRSLSSSSISHDSDGVFIFSLSPDLEDIKDNLRILDVDDEDSLDQVFKILKIELKFILTNILEKFHRLNQYHVLIF